MKKNYVLLAASLIFSITGFSQELTTAEKDVDMVPTVSDYNPKGVVFTPKAYGDTMAYFDFNGSMPAGWIADNISNNNFNWIWSTDAPGGQYSRNVDPLSSTTGANGYMLLRSDSFNTPFPPGGPVPMDAFFESTAIDIDSVPAVVVRFQQSYRYCCSSADLLELQVRADTSTTWTSFDAIGGVGANVTSANPTFTEINISSVAANSDSIFIRFFQGGASHYYWMIDDIAIVEGPTNDLVQESFITNYDTVLNISPQWQFYEQIPSALAVPMYVMSNVFNYGASADSNVEVQYEVFQDTTCMGTSGAGSVSLVEDTISGVLPAFGKDSLAFQTGFMPPAKGDYTITLSVSSSAVDQNPSNNSVSESFTISDTVYAKDDGVSNGVVGPGSYQLHDVDGARLLLHYHLPTAQVLTSLSYYIGNSDRNLNTSFTAVVYGYDRNAPNCDIATDDCFSTNVVASNPFAIAVDSTMFGTWVTVPLLNPVLLQAGGYAMGYEATGFTSVSDFVVGRDLNADAQAPYSVLGLHDAQTFIYAPGQGYGWINATPMMRMNFGQMDMSCYLVGVEEPQTNTAFDVAPNPNNGMFNIGISSDVSMNYTLRVTNMLGQNVYNEEISVSNNYLSKNMDLTHLDQGIYFVTLENGFERYTKKIIIN